MSPVAPTLLLADFSVMNPFWIVLACFFGFWILMATVESMHKTRQREHTVREVAAYVAERAIAPEAAERLLEVHARNELRERVSGLAAEGWINPESAERILGTARAQPFATPQPANV